MKDVSELVQTAQSGDSEAYNALIQRFQPMAYATAYRYLRDHHLAQDIVQEATIEAFVHLAQLKEPAAFPGWFRQIVFRQCTRVLRQATIPATSLETLGDDPLDDLLMESNPEDIAVRRELHAYVRAAIASLPQHERQVTELFYGYHYSYNEVCTFLKIPLTTVKKRLHAARQKLKVYLQAALHDANEIARHSSNDEANAETWLARWLLLWLKISVGTRFITSYAIYRPSPSNIAASRSRVSEALLPLPFPISRPDPNGTSPCRMEAVGARGGVGLGGGLALALLLGTRDWRIALEAENALAQAGPAGVDAALWGLSHPSVQVRRGCAGFLDHHGTDACFAALRQAALHDPAPSVRRAAVHSASCQRCKPCPLTGDLIGLLVQAALSDSSRRVRENAIGGLRYQPRDPRAIAALEEVLRTETDPRLRREAHHALKHQDPGYRAMVDAQARERGIAAARARAEKADTRD